MKKISILFLVLLSFLSVSFGLKIDNPTSGNIEAIKQNGKIVFPSFHIFRCGTHTYRYKTNNNQ